MFNQIYLHIINLIVFCCFLNLRFAECSFSYGFYKAAVVEYAARVETFLTPEENVNSNAEEYVKLIEKAGHHRADIIVFPEDGLTTIEAAKASHHHLISYGIEVPDLKHNPNPCVNESLDKVLRLFSCTARKANIYVVVNLIEKVKDGTSYIFYNTNVVFDRSGTIISRYRKINLFNEPHFKYGNEMVTFTTDFGVTFGMLVCADIFYKRPALDIVKDPNVTDIVMPSAWKSETPYLQALSIQAGYARATGVNLLAAGLSDPANMNTGSGIYLFDGRIAEIYTSPVHSHKVLIQEIPKIRIKLSAVKCNNNSHENPRFRLGGNLNVGSIVTGHQNMSQHTLLPLSQHSLETRATLCSYNRIFCCKFNVILEQPLGKSDPKYMLEMFYGVRELGDRTIGVRTCGLVACLRNDKQTCGLRLDQSRSSRVKFTNITIRGDFDRNADNYDQPATLTFDLTPYTEYTYCETLSDDKAFVRVDMKTTSTVSHLLAFGIHGRLYNYDGGNVGLITSDANFIRANCIFIVTLIVGIILG